MGGLALLLFLLGGAGAAAIGKMLVDLPPAPPLPPTPAPPPPDPLEEVWLPYNVEVYNYPGSSHMGSSDYGDPIDAIYVLLDFHENLRELVSWVILPAAEANPDTIFFVRNEGRPGVVNPLVKAVFGDRGWKGITSPRLTAYRSSNDDTALLLSAIHAGTPPGKTPPWLEVYQTLVTRAVNEMRKFQNFPLTSNKLLVSSQCLTALPGDRFMPQPGDVHTSAVEAPTLAATLAIPNNQALGYIDYLRGQGPQWTPQAIAARIILEAATMSGTDCAEQLEANWGVELANYYTVLAKQIEDYLNTGGIDYEPPPNP